MMQKFWDSALALEPPDDCDSQSQSDMSALMTNDGTDIVKSNYPSLGLGNSFAFKFEDLKGRMHRLNFGTETLEELLSAILQRIGASSDSDRPQLLYEDDDGDKVLLANDGDLHGAVSHARSVGRKVLRLHLDFSDYSQQTLPEPGTTTVRRTGWTSFHSSILVGGVVLTAIGVSVYLKRVKL